MYMPQLQPFLTNGCALSEWRGKKKTLTSLNKNLTTSKQFSQLTVNSWWHRHLQEFLQKRWRRIYHFLSNVGENVDCTAAIVSQLMQTWIGMMPGKMGHVIPIARQSRTNFRKTSASKNSWVMMKSAPASILALRCWRSSSYVGQSGWPVGYPSQKSYVEKVKNCLFPQRLYRHNRPLQSTPKHTGRFCSLFLSNAD